MVNPLNPINPRCVDKDDEATVFFSRCWVDKQSYKHLYEAITQGDYSNYSKILFSKEKLTELNRQYNFNSFCMSSKWRDDKSIFYSRFNCIVRPTKIHQVGCGRKICQLYLCNGESLPLNKCPGHDTKLQLIFVAATHQTGLETRSKARGPIKVGIKGRGRSGTSRDSNPASHWPTKCNVGLMSQAVSRT